MNNITLWAKVLGNRMIGQDQTTLSAQQVEDAIFHFYEFDGYKKIVININPDGSATVVFDWDLDLKEYLENNKPS